MIHPRWFRIPSNNSRLTFFPQSWKRKILGGEPILFLPWVWEEECGVRKTLGCFFLWVCDTCTFHTCPHYVSFTLKMSDQFLQTFAFRSERCRHLDVSKVAKVNLWFPIQIFFWRWNIRDWDGEVATRGFVCILALIYIWWFLHIYVIYIYAYISRYYKER